jgi:ABC-type Zn uptake system ZnuABC Zn-binding protein ZnuA
MLRNHYDSNIPRGCQRRVRGLFGAVLSGVCLTFAVAAHAADTLRVVATVPDLGSLANEIGGEAVSVTVVTKGPEDPHFAEAKPSFITALSQADAYIQMGLDLEIGYAPMLLNNARNANVLPGSAGYIDASLAITPLEVRSGKIDRSMGDVHPLGNPHYLLDPLRGLQVAALISDRFAQIRPQLAGEFRRRFDDFRRRLSEALVGGPLAEKYDAEKLALLYERGKLDDFLRSQGDLDALGGWLAAVRPFRGAQVVDDHRIWPYFTSRFGFEILGDLEPIPGIPPTTRHLTVLIEQMRGAGVRILLSSSYYDQRHANFVAQETGARVVPMAQQVGSRTQAKDYLSMIDYDVRSLVEALQAVGEGRES